MRAEIAAQVSHRAAFRPGHVLDLRHPERVGPETAPADSRRVFVGFSATGAPLFLDFAQWLLQSKHPQLDLLYARPPGLVIVVSPAEALRRGAAVPSASRPASTGRCTARWRPAFSRCRGRTAPGQLALDFPGAVLGGQGGRPAALRAERAGHPGRAARELEHLMDRLARKAVGAAAWQTRRGLGASGARVIERSQGKSGGDPAPASSRAIEGILGGPVPPRAGPPRAPPHANTPKSAACKGDRPTSHALRDAWRWTEDILVDALGGTFVVLGDRGRAHVWSGQGKLVT